MGSVAPAGGGCGVAATSPAPQLADAISASPPGDGDGATCARFACGVPQFGDDGKAEFAEMGGGDARSAASAQLVAPPPQA